MDDPTHLILDPAIPAGDSVLDLRFLCDEMLGRLGRYLRAAGYDTLLATGGVADSELLKLAISESRRFLTLDQQILEHKAAAGIALLLPIGDLDSHAAFLGAVCGVHWTRRAFTRCLVDNTPFVRATAAQRAALPLGLDSQPVSFCPTCGRVYWPGSHYRRMRERLLRWQGE